MRGFKIYNGAPRYKIEFCCGVRALSECLKVAERENTRSFLFINIGTSFNLGTCRVKKITFPKDF